MDVHNVRVFLIGGTSHTGKSTLAQFLASQLGWDYRTTDTLARHPGRPWKPKPEQVPPHVAEHYLSLPVDELIVDVLRHYRETIWPLAHSIIVHHATDPSAGCLVMEGSALWPERVATLTLPNVAAVWLTASDDLLERRIYASSQYETKLPTEQAMIDKFLARTRLYNAHMMEAVRQLGLARIDVDAASTTEVLVARCLDMSSISMERIGQHQDICIYDDHVRPRQDSRYSSSVVSDSRPDSLAHTASANT